MNHFAISLFAVLVFLAAMGWSTHAVMQRGGPESERFFRAIRGVMIAGIFFFLIFIVNYILASTGLKRSIMAEKIFGKDPIASYFFSGSGMRINHLWALVIVFASFICSGVFLRELGAFVTAVRNRLWATDAVGFIGRIVSLLFWASVAATCLYLDTALLIFRSATLMWMQKYCMTAASMPDPDTIIKENLGTMGSFLLAAFRIWYPLTVLAAEKHMASSMAFLVESSRQLSAVRAQAAQPQQVPVAAQIPAGIPVAPPPAPAPVPAPVVTVGVGGAAPGGAAQWVRPIPFNPGPRNGGNGNRPVGV